ncbi:HAD family hydrolase [Holophaga foetida]|uniref:HAD family hydrolase n=1 Tax=Holophaga foetida TaxID=35839 RepID=UPI0002E2E300|nr:HAD family hydrolase [Holophaga foetida]
MKLIVWDFDGTLVDSRPLIEAGMTHALDKLGLPRTLMQEWLKYVGLPVEVGIQRSFGSLGLSFDEVLKAYRGFGHAEHEGLLRAFPGMDDLLSELAQKGIPMALATSKRTLPLLRQLERLGWTGRFDPIITPDQVTHGKPHPESLERCLAAHDLKPEEAVMVGDTPFDMEMAQRAGVPRVAVGHGFYDQASMMDYTPLAFAPDTQALRATLLELFPAPEAQ